MLPSCLVFAALLQLGVAQMDTTGCGTIKGCLFAPNGCNSGGGCQMSLSFQRNGNSLILELQGKPPSGGYLAVGFSRDMNMGDDSVSLCYNNQQQLAYNEGRSVILLQEPSFQDLQNFTNTNGETFCRMRRTLTGANDDRVFDLNDPYVVFLAYGPVNQNEVGYHQMNKWMLPRTELTSYSTDSGFSPSTRGTQMDPVTAPPAGVRSNEDQLRVAHGICMSLGWMIFFSTGILFARFFRDHLPQTTPCGVKMWFHGHRIFQSIGVGLTICGFVMIFVANDWRWSGPRAGATREENQTWNSIHSICGLLACVIAWAQPLNAVFRCHPGEKGRFVFNWIHRFFGFGSWLLAAAAIMIACVHFDLMFSSRAAAFGLFIAFVAAFGLCLIVFQLLQTIGWVRQRRGAVGADMEMVRIDGHTRVVLAASNSGIRRLQSILFIPYLVVAWGTCIAICVLIGKKPIF